MYEGKMMILLEVVLFFFTSLVHSY